MNHDKPFFKRLQRKHADVSHYLLYHFISNIRLGTRLCGVYFKFLWFFVGYWCAFNRIWDVMFTFNSLHPELKRNFQICFVRSFVWTMVNQFMLIKFRLIGRDMFLQNYLKTAF